MEVGESLFSSKELVFGCPKERVDALDCELREILQWSDFLYQEAFSANNELRILELISTNNEAFKDALESTSCFFSHAYSSMSESVFISCAKMFEASWSKRNRNQTITLKMLLDKCMDQVTLIEDEYRRRFHLQYGYVGREQRIKRTICRDEKELYTKNKDLAKVIRTQESYNALLGFPDCRASDGLTCSVTIEQLFKMYDLRYGSLEKCIENVKKQRNKIYVHNDKKGMSQLEAFLRESPVYLSDIRRLIDLSLNLTQDVCALITGISRPALAANSDDVMVVLQFMDQGMKSQGESSVSGQCSGA